jgi:hypothetical protein
MKITKIMERNVRRGAIPLLVGGFHQLVLEYMVTGHKTNNRRICRSGVKTKAQAG